MAKTDPLLSEIDNLRDRLSEALEALEAIRSGDVDALVVYGENGEQVYTLQSADQTYRVMVESINEGAATLSGEGIVTWANSCLAEMLKMPLETLLGSQVTAAIGPGDRKVFEAILDKSRQGKCKVELDLLAQDNSLIPVLLSLSPIPAAGQVTICLVVTDLTEHKLNAQIAAAERVAKAIIEQAAESIVVCDVEGKIVQASQSAIHLARENPMFKPFEEAFVLTPETVSPPEVPFSIAAVLGGEVFQGVEATLKDSQKDGPVNLLLSAKALHIPGDGRLGCVITMTDVTERKQAEQAIRQYAERLERSNKDLEDFAFVASHDLQEPLRKVQAFGRMLIENYSVRLEEEGCGYIRRMQEAASRMEKMINDLLAYSRVSKQSRPFEPVDLNKVVKNVLSDLESRIQTSGGQVETGDLPTIEADPVQMQQLLQNLLGNALKFHKPGEQPVVKVYARQAADGGKSQSPVSPPAIEILVEDNGIGFDMQHLERIFQPFQRLHGRSEYEGSGIGLSICRRIVERHHGSIAVNSEPGVGSMFIISLPLRQKK